MEGRLAAIELRQLRLEEQHWRCLEGFFHHEIPGQLDWWTTRWFEQGFLAAGLVHLALAAEGRTSSDWTHRKWSRLVESVRSILIAQRQEYSRQSMRRSRRCWNRRWLIARKHSFVTAQMSESTWCWHNRSGSISQTIPVQDERISWTSSVEDGLPPMKSQSEESRSRSSSISNPQHQAARPARIPIL